MQLPILRVHKRKQEPTPIRQPPPHILPTKNPFPHSASRDVLRQGIEHRERDPGGFAAVDVAGYLVQEEDESYPV